MLKRNSFNKDLWCTVLALLSVSFVCLLAFLVICLAGSYHPSYYKGYYDSRASRNGDGSSWEDSAVKSVSLL